MVVLLYLIFRLKRGRWDKPDTTVQTFLKPLDDVNKSQPMQGADTNQQPIKTDVTSSEMSETPNSATAVKAGASEITPVIDSSGAIADSTVLVKQEIDNEKVVSDKDGVVEAGGVPPLPSGPPLPAEDAPSLPPLPMDMEESTRKQGSADLNQGQALPADIPKVDVNNDVVSSANNKSIPLPEGKEKNSDKAQKLSESPVKSRGQRSSKQSSRSRSSSGSRSRSKSAVKVSKKEGKSKSRRKSVDKRKGRSSESPRRKSPVRERKQRSSSPRRPRRRSSSSRRPSRSPVRLRRASPRRRSRSSRRERRRSYSRSISPRRYSPVPPRRRSRSPRRRRSPSPRRRHSRSRSRYSIYPNYQDTFTHFSHMDFPIPINWTSPFMFLGLLGGIFHFYSKLKRTFCMQTEETLNRCCVLWHLIWVCAVCLCPTKRMLCFYGVEAPRKTA